MTRTILAIDDSPTIRQLVKLVLVGEGWNVVSAEDGEAGLARLSECKPQVVITDLNMPRMNGLRFIAAARQTEAGRATPILVLTTESDAERKARARAAGATGWIIKPFNPKQLIDAVNRVAPSPAAA